MAIANVFTQPVAEIDVRNSRLSAVASRFAHGSVFDDTVDPSTAGTVLYITDEEDLIVQFEGKVIMSLDLPCFYGPSEPGPKSTPHVSLDDITRFVGPAALGVMKHPRDRFTPMGRRQSETLTDWLRSVAEDEISRPILDIEEDGAIPPPECSKATQALVTVSRNLQQKSPPKQAGGLGYVNAGLLLWLESSAEDSGDA